MSLHFVGSRRNQAGKSWFIRAAIEYLRQKSPVVMLDASADKLVGEIYNPSLNYNFNLRFDCHSIEADRLIEIADRGVTAIVKIPAYDNLHFENWIENIEIDRLDIPIYYWHINSGYDRLSTKIIKVFGTRFFIVDNEHYFNNLSQDDCEYRDIKRLSMQKFGISTKDTREIELTKKGLVELTLDMPTISRTRIHRFLRTIFNSIEKLITLEVKLH
jgi:hypothetical protein